MYSMEFDEEGEILSARRTLRDNLLTLYAHYTRHHAHRMPASGSELEGASGVSNSALSRYAPRKGAVNTSANLDHLARIAAAYKLPVWALLYPGLNPANPPTVRSPEMDEQERQILEAAVKLLVSKGGPDVAIAQGDAGADRGRAADRKVPGKGAHDGKRHKA